MRLNKMPKSRPHFGVQREETANELPTVVEVVCVLCGIHVSCLCIVWPVYIERTREAIRDNGL